MIKIELPELEQVLAAQAETNERLAALEAAVGIAREWWTLKAACARKGIEYGTARNQRQLQPAGGIPDGYLVGRKVWRWSTIATWLQQIDAAPPAVRALPRRQKKRS